jgi:hypothetical protein
MLTINKDICLDLAGYGINATITGKAVAFIVDGEDAIFTITDTSDESTGFISKWQYTTDRVVQVMNDATFNMEGGLLRAYQMSVFNVSGIANINGGELEANTYGFYNYATSTITNTSVVSSKYGVINSGATAVLTLADGAMIEATGASAEGVYNYAGTVNINGGTITALNTSAGTWGYGIDSSLGTINLTDGQVYAGDAEEGLGASTAGIVLWGDGNANSVVLNMSGGTVVGTSYAITGNGQAKYAGTAITITGGTISQFGSDGGAIYHPQNGILIISAQNGNEVNIAGANGIQLCSGEGVIVDISGDVYVVASGTDNRATKTGDGFIDDGAAISIVNRNYPGGTPRMTISGGNFLSLQGEALLAYTWSNNTASEWATANEYFVIQGGVYSSDPSAFVDEDNYTVTHIQDAESDYYIVAENASE